MIFNVDFKESTQVINAGVTTESGVITKAAINQHNKDKNAHADLLKGYAKPEDVEKTTDQAMKKAQNLYANAIKGTASGQIVRVDDVSPIEHTIKAKISGENIDTTTVTVTKYGKNLLKFDDVAKSITSADGMNLSANISEGQLSLSGIFNAGVPKGKVIYPDMTLRNVNYHTYAYILEELSFKIPSGTYTFSANESISSDVDVISGAYLLVGELNGSVKDGTAANYKSGTTFIVDNDNSYCMPIVYVYGDGVFENFKYTAKPLLEVGDTATEYEPYKEAETYTPATDGTVDIVSISPTMTLATDTAGAIVDIEYNKDINKANFGGGSVDLSNYYTKSEVDNLVSGGVVGLTDTTTGKTYALYVENGKLKLEEKGG